jgi:hypothetical protein
VKKSEVQHFFSELACNQSIVPPVHFTLCPKLDIHGTDPAFVDSIVKMSDRVRHLHQNNLKHRPITSYFHHN